MTSAKSNLAAALTALLMATAPAATLVTNTIIFPEPDALPAHPALPDPLTTFIGQPVKTPEDWIKVRAPELRALFQHYMYGRGPAQVHGGAGKVIREDKAALGGKATLREVLVECGLDHPVHLLIVIPNDRPKPVACFLGMNFNGNYALLDDPLIPPPAWLPPRATAATGRGKDKDAWALDQAVERGYAVATFFSGDVLADDKETAPAKLKTFALENQDPAAGDVTATVMLWAWGFSRMLDYVQTVPEIDAKRVACVGHSQIGRASCRERVCYPV